MLEQPNTELMDRFGVKAIFQFTQVNRERLTKLAQWLDQNNINIHVDRHFQWMSQLRRSTTRKMYIVEAKSS